MISKHFERVLDTYSSLPHPPNSPPGMSGTHATMRCGGRSLSVLNVPTFQDVKDKELIYRSDLVIVGGFIVKSRSGQAGRHVGGVFLVYEEERI